MPQYIFNNETGEWKHHTDQVTEHFFGVIYCRLSRLNTARGSGTGLARVKAGKSILFTGDIPEVEMKNMCLKIKVLLQMLYSQLENQQVAPPR